MLLDRKDRYGTVTKIVHWSMAALMFWQFSGPLCERILGEDAALTKLLSKNHGQVGTVLFLLIVFRMLWALLNRNQRPPHQTGIMGYAARLGHFSLYVLMLLVPTTALLRSWGGERAFAPFGFEIFSARSPDQVIRTATDIGANFHGELAWIIGALILGHIFFAATHHLVLKDGTWQRMIG
ncbi:cytochrome b [Paracoccus sp. (in: a-proteobacteria)]|uniref:cytochrome b n=1 Tax=Paracoccus sp. TaxID=267 RepID=UPI0028AC4F1D|nr:cytochrome b [Paracoccus sp. (in: a-proteobacteria)]